MSPEEPEKENVQTSAAVPDVKAPKATGQPQHIFRNFIRWTFGLLIVFGLGALTILYTYYIPTRRQAIDYKASLDKANQRITQLSSEAQQASIYKTQLNDANLHGRLLFARAQVDEARLALASKDITAAHSALDGISAVLIELAGKAPSAQLEAVTAMQSRLNMALGELDKDSTTAQADLAVLATKLKDLENTLYP